VIDAEIEVFPHYPSTPDVGFAERPFAGPLASETFNSSGNRQPPMGCPRLSALIFCSINAK
jgi:hypothetical protein